MVFFSNFIIIYNNDISSLFLCPSLNPRVGLFFSQNFGHLRSDWLPDDSTCFAQFGMYRESIEEFVDNRDGSTDGISRLSSI